MEASVEAFAEVASNVAFMEDFVEATSMEASLEIFVVIPTASVKETSTEVFVEDFGQAFLDVS